IRRRHRRLFEHRRPRRRKTMRLFFAFPFQLGCIRQTESNDVIFYFSKPGCAIAEERRVCSSPVSRC
ncbi:hypothetical protein PMAYCL1PPCAC_10367, partial [Pristionchus mayeri]